MHTTEPAYTSRVPARSIIRNSCSWGWSGRMKLNMQMLCGSCFLRPPGYHSGKFKMRAAAATKIPQERETRGASNSLAPRLHPKRPGPKRRPR
eukprot:1801590-Pyramimonas_sp.AAC.1